MQTDNLEFDVVDEDLTMRDDAEQQILQNELIAMYSEATGYVNKEVWLRANEIFVELTKFNSRYQKYHFSSQNMADSVNPVRFRQVTRSVIDVMAADFGLLTLAEHTKNGSSPSSAGLTFNTNNHLEANPHQVSSQQQNLDISVELKIHNLEQEIKSRLSSDQRKEVDPIIAEIKKDTSDWSLFEKLIRVVLKFGRDIAVNVIAAAIAIYLPRK